MKKVVVLTVRLDSEIDEAIRSLAKADDRKVAWVARKLITEALIARKLLAPADEPIIKPAAQPVTKPTDKS